MNETQVIFYPKKSKPVTLNCEIAKTISEKMTGLMHRDHLPLDKGMLFPFLFPWIRFFWMKNVKIPLDIIFINSKLEIIKIYEAPVKSGFFYKQYWSHGFCKYVIECNIGFCKKHNITKGTKIEI
jgi:uncharacterized membrane protein (UPF0127 family)